MQENEGITSALPSQPKTASGIIKPTQATPPATSHVAAPLTPKKPGLIHNPAEGPAVERPEGSYVQNQMTDLLDKDNPYMKQAETQALQNMNTRGLLNSSMAVGAVEDARIRHALPIAQQDADSEYRDYLMVRQTNEQLRAMGFEMSGNLQSQMGNSVTTIMATTRQVEASIMSDPNMSAENKQKAVADLRASRDADLNMLNSVWGKMPAFQSSWAIGAPGGEVGPIKPGVISTPAPAPAPASAPAPVATTPATSVPVNEGYQGQSRGGR